jgi:hypothetical protein
VHLISPMVFNGDRVATLYIFRFLSNVLQIVDCLFLIFLLTIVKQKTIVVINRTQRTRIILLISYGWQKYRLGNLDGVLSGHD